MPSYKITYFPVKALAEPWRFLFSYGGIEFEDFRFEREDWPKIKPTMPMGQAPILEVDGRIVHQSSAVARYLGNLVGLDGKDAWENLQIDIAYDTINDFRAKLAVVSYEADEKIKETKFITLTNETIPFYLGKLDAIVKANNGYFANGKLSWVDLFFVAVLDYLNYMAKQDLTSKWSNLQALKEKVLAIENIKRWVAKRPESEF